MKWIPDAEGEAFVLENDWEIAVPISFETVNGELSVSFYPSCEGEAKAFFEKHESDPFSEAALSDLYALFCPFFQKHGYKDDRFRDRWGYIFRGTGNGGETNAVRLTGKDEDRNGTTYDLSLSDREGLLMYGVIDGDRVVSVAVTHGAVTADTGIAEFGVETVPAARKRGYATASARALIAELSRRGITAEYRCQRYNRASRAVAEHAGLLPVGKYYYYVGRK